MIFVFVWMIEVIAINYVIVVLKSFYATEIIIKLYHNNVVATFQKEVKFDICFYIYINRT